MPLSCGNQLIALTPWTPNFSDPPLATAHMTDPVSHRGWSEQISPLAHSSQSTWQPYNFSHCIKMHNTHLLGSTGQLSQMYFTHWISLCQLHVTVASTPAERQLPRYTVYYPWVLLLPVSVRLSACPSVNFNLVHTVTCHRFELESPNMLPRILSAGIENRGYWPWPSRSFWHRILGNWACVHVITPWTDLG